MPVFDIYQELRAMVTALNEEGMDYALCGGLALAVHAEPRATKDWSGPNSTSGSSPAMG